MPSQLPSKLTPAEFNNLGEANGRLDRRACAGLVICSYFRLMAKGDSMLRRAKVRTFLLSTAFWLASADQVWPLAPVNDSLLRNLIPLASFRRDFKITEGKDQGRVVPLMSRPDIVDNKKLKITFGDYAAVYLTQNPMGVLLLERLDLIKNRSYVIYDPALPVLPSELSSIGGFQRETRYRMFSSDTGRIKRSGRVTHSVRRVSSSRFDTPAGAVDGFFIEMDHLMEMELMSELRINLGLGCREGEGPVFATGQFTLTRLGVFSNMKRVAAGIMP
jgi:hypothetical protein